LADRRMLHATFANASACQAVPGRDSDEIGSDRRRSRSRARACSEPAGCRCA
jgi:hypothetical protein